MLVWPLTRFPEDTRRLTGCHHFSPYQAKHANVNLGIPVRSTKTPCELTIVPSVKARISTFRGSEVGSSGGFFLCSVSYPFAVWPVRLAFTGPAVTSTDSFTNSSPNRDPQCPASRWAHQREHQGTASAHPEQATQPVAPPADVVVSSTPNGLEKQAVLRR